jgi:hypothetical protein
VLYESSDEEGDETGDQGSEDTVTADEQTLLGGLFEDVSDICLFLC